MGHAEAYGLCDVLARYRMQRGDDVLHPIGWDSFGLPAENAAIKRDEHPATYTYANIETQAESFRRYGISFDWSRRLHTSDPAYYRWTQWLFLRFRERGLAYRKSSAVNWCPQDQTVLANEQVVQGACERCGAVVTKRELTQWFFKVTDYADRLLDGHGAAARGVAGPGPEDAGELDRPLPGRARRLRGAAGRRRGSGPSRCSPPGPTPCTGRPSSSSPRTPRWPPSCARRTQREALEAYREQVRALSRHRAAVHRPGEDRRRPGRHRAATRSPASRSRSTPRTTCWPTTAPARSWRCPRTTSATSTSPARFGLPVRVVVDTGARGPGRDRASRPPARARWSTPAPTTA